MPQEHGVLRAHLEDLSRITNETGDAAINDPKNPAKLQAADAAKATEDQFRQRIKPAATMWGDFGRGMQGETNVIDGSFTSIRRLFNEPIEKGGRGRDIKPQEIPTIKAKAKMVKQAIERHGKAVEALDKEITRGVKPGRIKIESMDHLRDFIARKLKESAPC